MRSRLLGLAILLLGAGVVGADSSMPPALSNPIAPLESLDLDLTCTLPAEGPDVAQGLLVVRLYEYDPRKADSMAIEVAQVSLAGIVHKTGMETVFRFPCRGTTARRKSYYLTAVVYPAATAADSAGLYFIDGFQRVLLGGNRQALSVTLTPVADTAGPTN